MKIFKVSLAFTLIAFNLGLAEDEFDPLGAIAEADMPKMVRVQLEYIEIPQATMTELLAEPRKSANDADLRAKLQELINTEKAKMIETQMITARSGQKAISESIHEFIYPTEYDSLTPQVPNSEDGSAKNPPPIATTFGPLAFETRNLGSTLEIEPTIGEDDTLIDLRVNPQLVYHTGNYTWNEVKVGENTCRVQMPNIYVIRADTSMTLINGQTFLMSANSPKDDKGEADFSKKILIFVRADVLVVGR